MWGQQLSQLEPPSLTRKWCRQVRTRKLRKRVRTEAPHAPNRVLGERRPTRVRRVQVQAPKGHSQGRELLKTKAMTRQEETDRVGATTSSQHRPGLLPVHSSPHPRLPMTLKVQKERQRKKRKEKAKRRPRQEESREMRKKKLTTARELKGKTSLMRLQVQLSRTLTHR